MELRFEVLLSVSSLVQMAAVTAGYRRDTGGVITAHTTLKLNALLSATLTHNPTEHRP